jgi:hypothetical protein
MPAADFQPQSVAHDSAEAIEALAQVGGSENHVNPSRWPKSKHSSRVLESFQCLDHSTQLHHVKIPVQLDTPALAQYHRHGPWSLTICAALPTDYFDSHQPFAIAFSLESSLQRTESYPMDAAELTS